MMNTNCKQFEDVNEEFNNFMYRVTEVSDIIKKLNSSDSALQQIGQIEADNLLQHNDHEKRLANIDSDEVVLTVKSNKTLINKKALVANENPNTMSQDAFMDEVSKDADQRYKDRLIRTERMETLKKQATLAFRRGEYERALNCYNKAIEQIKDLPLLYNNRSLTYLKLELYEKAIQDAETALKLNENCLKSYLFLAKAHWNLRNKKQFMNAINEAKERNPKQIDFINDFCRELENSSKQGD